MFIVNIKSQFSETNIKKYLDKIENFGNNNIKVKRNELGGVVTINKRFVVDFQENEHAILVDLEDESFSQMLLNETEVFETIERIINV